MTLNYDFSGKTVLVTGGSRGIGFKLVESLAESGAKVISLSRNVENIEKMNKDKPKLSVEGIKCDISKWDETNCIVKSLPHVDCLVNNAATGRVAEFGEILLDDIDYIFDTNVKSIINISQVITNKWKKDGFHGVVVNVSSITSKTVLPSSTTYAASKAAIDSITRSMALELGPFNIRVNCVNPTGVLTDMGRYYFDEEHTKRLLSRTPLGRFGEVQEIADIIMYLLTDRCTLVTGAIIGADGGYWGC